MTIDTLASLKTKLSCSQNLWIYKDALSVGSSTGKMFSTWTQTPGAGVAPTTAVVPTSATTGALNFINPPNSAWIGQVNLSVGLVGDFVIICDRLSHSGGLNGTVTTAQTTNLPTAALTRYAGSFGVYAALEIYSQIGTSSTTVTATYTNSGGTGSRITPLAAFGATNFREARRFMVLPLQEGDAGVSSVESVTVTATTGTAGNFGVTLFKPLFAMPCATGGEYYAFNSFLNSCGNFAGILDDACLFSLIVCRDSSTGAIQGNIQIVQD